MDFAEPPAPVEDMYGQLLAVRDLASGYQLLWLPTEYACGATAVAAVQALFREHGKPLILKTDNGSPFIADAFQSFLRRHRIWQLFSPPDLPRYNGSCEAGIGSMKTRTHHQASRRGFPGQWTCEDMEAARLQANETARPWGHRGPTPEESWQARAKVSRSERSAFARTVRACEREWMREQPNAKTHAVSRREAIARACVRNGLLEFTSTYVPEPFPPRRRCRREHSSE